MAGVPIGLTPPQLLERARAVTGIDRDDPDAVEPLEILVASLDGESELHHEGSQEMRRKLVRLLSNRLRMARDFGAHPEIAHQVIRPPIFLFGMARTGTTKTQKLLASSGDFNWLPLWQVMNPSLHTGRRTESPDPRIREIDAFADWYRLRSPHARRGHEFATHEAEEDSFLLEHHLVTPVFLGWSVVNSYLRWLVTQDLKGQFVFLRDALKYLQWQGLADPTKRWVLKSPLYHASADLVLDVFPGADVVMTHRSPLESVPSLLRQLETFYRPYTDRLVDIDQQVAGLANGITRHLRLRDRHPGWSILDVDLADVVGEPSPLVERIYDFIDEPLADDSRRRMVAWDRSHPPHPHGRHDYSLEAFGLDPAAITEQFAPYLGFRGETFGG